MNSRYTLDKEKHYRCSLEKAMSECCAQWRANDKCANTGGACPFRKVVEPVAPACAVADTVRRIEVAMSTPVATMNEQARQINADVQRDNGMAGEEETVAAAPPKCADCRHHGGPCLVLACEGAPLCLCGQRRYPHQVCERSVDGNCGHTGRFFERRATI